eukprot:COSAG01_NODE_2830_length_6998_cov_17.705754_3_plen_35_part_00
MITMRTESVTEISLPFYFSGVGHYYDHDENRISD